MDNGLKHVFGATYRTDDDEILLIHFSDDVLVSCKPESIGRIEEIIKSRFDIAFTPVDRWVSMEFEQDCNELRIMTRESALGMQSTRDVFKLKHLEFLRLTGDKVPVPSEFRSAVGKLNYLATFNPHLRFYVSFLSEAGNYDPENAQSIVERLIALCARRPFVLRFPAITPRFVCIYSDANHSLKSFRGHWGCVVQFQESDQPGELENVVMWTGGRLAKLYDSVFLAE